MKCTTPRYIVHLVRQHAASHSELLPPRCDSQGVWTAFRRGVPLGVDVGRDQVGELHLLLSPVHSGRCINRWGMKDGEYSIVCTHDS